MFSEMQFLADLVTFTEETLDGKLYFWEVGKHCYTSRWLMVDDLFRKWLSYFINLLTTNVPQHVDTSQLICRANQLAGFYI